MTKFFCHPILPVEMVRLTVFVTQKVLLLPAVIWRQMSFIKLLNLKMQSFSVTRFPKDSFDTANWNGSQKCFSYY